MIHTHIVKQIIVEILCPRLAKLLVKDLVTVLFAVYILCMKLGGKLKIFSGMTACQRGFDRVFTVITAIHPRGVEIGEAFF